MKSNINVIDIETFGNDELTPYCCCAIIRGSKISSYGIDCIQNILNYINSLKIENIIIFAHNLTFDGSLILNKLDHSWEVESWKTIIRKGDIYSLCIKKNNFYITFKCSSKLLPIELSEIARKLDIPNKIDLNHKTINKDNYNDIDIKNMVKMYCERDVEIVNQFMVKLSFSLNKYVKDWYINCFSISGVAYKIFKDHFNSFKIPLNIDRDLDNEIRKAYYGGRCEVFGNPYEDDYIYHFDFTGMYSNRLKELFPIGKPKKISKPKWENTPGFYYIRVKSNLKLPILPYRCKNSGKLLFPNGIFEGVYWYEEISLFLREGGEILCIYWGLLYEKEERVFLDFANHCIESRNKSKIDKLIWKLIPNSFIGRLGLRSDEEKTIIINDEDYDPRNMNVINDKKINKKWIVRIKEDSINKKVISNVTYAAIVTSKSRVVWWEHANTIVNEGGRLLYCDTDSLFIAFKKDMINKRWGEVYLDEKKEDTVVKKACFACSKAYSVVFKENNVTKIKGIPQKNIKNMDFNEFEKLFNNEEYRKIKMDLFRKKNLKIKIEEIFKIVKINEYDKRVFYNNKKETKALIVKN